MTWNKESHTAVLAAAFISVAVSLRFCFLLLEVELLDLS